MSPAIGRANCFGRLPDDTFSWQDPYAAEILQMRRDSVWKLSRRNEALAALEAAAELRPESLDVQWALGKLLFELEQYERAREHLEIVLTLDPNHQDARQLLEQIP